MTNEIFSRFLIQVANPDYLNPLLKKIYQKNNMQNEVKLSYSASQRIVYFIKQGQLYWEQFIHAPESISSVSGFYALVQFFKALVIANNPLYPENQQVLAHGLTLKKTKANSDSLLKQTVKIQPKGLFSKFHTDVFRIDLIENECVSISDMLLHLPEYSTLQKSYERPYVFEALLPLHTSIFTVPSILIDNYYVDENRFIALIQQKYNTTLFLQGNQVLYDFSDCNCSFLDSFTNIPMLPLHRDPLLHFNELAAHFILIYSFSMYSRYESDWWGDMMCSMPSEEQTIIRYYLQIFKTKVPLLVMKQFDLLFDSV